MKHLLRIIGLLTLLAVFASPSGAATICTPLAPKHWEGDVKAGDGGWASTTAFEKNGCAWPGGDQWNGSDGLVFDMTDYSGLPVSISSTETSARFAGVQGFFLNDQCQRIGFWGNTEEGAALSVVVPEGTKYNFIYPNAGATSVHVTMDSAGKTCTIKKKKKKKH